MKPLRLVALLIAAIIHCGSGAYFGAQMFSRPSAPSGPDAVSHLMSLTLPDAHGQSVALRQYQGRWVVINFWATWCPPCIEEMPALSALQQQLSGKPVQIIGIGIDSAAKIEAFARKTPVVYPLLVAEAQGLDLLRGLGNESGGLPFTVVIGPDGRVVDRVTGTVDLSKLRDRLNQAGAG